MEQIETQIVFVRNLPRIADKDAVVALFAPFGQIMQVRMGVEERTLGTAFVVYRGVESARAAVRHMNGYYMDTMYLNVAFWQPFDKFRTMMSQ